MMLALGFYIENVYLQKKYLLRFLKLIFSADYGRRKRNAFRIQVEKGMFVNIVFEVNLCHES